MRTLLVLPVIRLALDALRWKKYQWHLRELNPSLLHESPVSNQLDQGGQLELHKVYSSLYQRFLRIQKKNGPCVVHGLQMWRWAFLVVRPQPSSPHPNFSKPKTRTAANLDFWSWLTYQLLGRLISTIPLLQILLPWLGIDNPCRIVFFWVCRWTSAWRGLMTGIFGILESSAAQWCQDSTPT